jgi:hypothetical protein
MGTSGGYHATSGDYAFGILVVGFMVFWIIRYAIRMWQRRIDMREMASRLGLQSWPNDSLPRDLSLRETPFEDWTNLFNIYTGIVSGVRVAVLDFRWRMGKYSWSRTIIAAKTTNDVFASKPFDLEVLQSGQWQLLFPPKELINSAKLLDVAEIEEALNNIRRATASTERRPLN